MTALYATLIRLNAAAESDRLRAGTYAEIPAYRNGDDDMERRAALQFLAGLGTLGISGEPLRQLLDLSLGHVHRPIEDWEPACADHLHALRTRPPAKVASDLLIDLFAIRRQLDTSTPSDATELQRVLSALSCVMANALTRVGDHGAAIRWWHTARQAADASGDLVLRLMVRGEEAGHGLYGQRDPEAVLRLVHNAHQIMKKPYLTLLTAEAKALSLLGRHREARTALNDLQDAVEQGGASDPLGFWKADQIHFAESWVHAGAGDEIAADTARENVLHLARTYQYQSNVHLHGALCTVVQGGIDQGMRQAASVIDALAPAYRSRHIIETGRMVLRAVPRGQQDRPSVAEFRELLAVEPTRSA
ncbi:hypothetical protein [Sphaerisporangium sp. TRM90804]|uniref:hypothetical protein n=1 Tax=Sphaerisporangium sp. TRM90804 TaxID=3031113 RepID=UPI00244D4F2D|nr:hypothetical protein [Sphaerisporangium sp. TRM90804]MDH2429876.1 hypothetical protein [Sphaerisporangium sp. TRM90804]